MASGTIYGKTSDSNIDAKIEWTSEVDYSKNESLVRASLYYKRNSAGTTSGSGTFSVTIAGTKWNFTNTITITEGTWVNACGAGTTIKHSSDGTRSVSISASGSISGTTLTSTSASGTVKLDNIPTESSSDMLSCSTRYFDGELSYKYTPKNASFYDRCNISVSLNGEQIEVKSIDLGQKATTQQTLTITLGAEELGAVYRAIPKDESKGNLRFTLCTYTDADYSYQIGATSYKELLLNIPDNEDTKPTANMILRAVNGLSAPFDTLYIEDITMVDADFTNGDGRYGASIKSYNLSVAGGDYGAPYTSGYLTTSGDVMVRGTVTNSRGFSRDYVETISVIPYSKPKVSPAPGENSIICARSDDGGNLTESGTYLRIRASRSYSTVSVDGVQKNLCTLRYRCVPEGTSFDGDNGWITLIDKSDTSTNTVDITLGGVVSSTETAYIVQLGVIDDLGMTSVLLFNISTDFVTIHIPASGKGKKIGIGRYVGDMDKDGVYFGLPLFGGYSDYVVETGTFETDGGVWRYKKWQDGTCQLFGRFTVTPTESTSSGGLYRSNAMNIPCPFKISSVCVSGTATNRSWISVLDTADNNILFELLSDQPFSVTSSVDVGLIAMGEYD